MTQISWTNWKAWRLVNTVRESIDITSYCLKPADGGALPDFRAGQAVALRAPGIEPRAYALCCTPNDAMIRLSVKAGDDPEAGMPGYLSRMKIGDTVEVSDPAGDFTIDKRDTPLVILAEGPGIAPVIAFLSELSTETPLRPVHVLYAAKFGRRFPLGAELRKLAGLLPNAGLGIFFTHPEPNDRIGVDYNAAGYITIDKIRSVCLDPEADYYIAGRHAFVSSLSESLAALRVIASRIHVMQM